MLLFRSRPGQPLEPISLPRAGEFPLDGVARLVLSDGAACVLLARRDVSVNGCAALPVVVLVECDEIRAGAETYYLGLREAARVAFAAGESKTCCARCTIALEAGQPVVYCPSCRSPHHEECWHYAPQCAGCNRAAAPVGRPE